MIVRLFYEKPLCGCHNCNSHIAEQPRIYEFLSRWINVSVSWNIPLKGMVFSSIEGC